MAKAAALKKIECDPPCGFKAISHDEDELIEIAVKHAEKFHNMKFTKEEIEEMRKTDIKEA